MLKYTRTFRRLAVTLMELLVVVLIISILATIATGVYSGQTSRARIAATKDLIHQLSVAITRYEVDTGSLPPSGSGTETRPSEMTATSPGSRQNGSGYLHMALVYSLSGNASKPASALWHGPYLNLQAEQVGAPSTAEAAYAGMINILDSWKQPVLYVNYHNYTASGAMFWGGTRVFSGSRPTGANPDLPAPNPFAATGETFYNPSTYQIISFGPDAKTMGVTSALGSVFSYAGTDENDINNFGY